MCSGKGVCDWSLSKPACKCFDENDLTDGCYDSGVNEPDKSEPSMSTSLKPGLSSKACGFLFVVAHFWMVLFE